MTAPHRPAAPGERLIAQAEARLAAGRTDGSVSKHSSDQARPTGRAPKMSTQPEVRPAPPSRTPCRECGGYPSSDGEWPQVPHAPGCAGSDVLDKNA